MDRPLTSGGSQMLPHKHQRLTVRALFQSSIFRYLGVGGTAFLVDFIITVTARDLLHFELWIAVALGYWAGFVINFSLQRNFAFQSDRPYVVSLAFYFALVGFNWAVTTALMNLFVQFFDLPTAVGKLICTALTTLWNYPIYRFLVFPRAIGGPAPAFREAPSSIDFVLPAHNASTVINKTVDTLAEWSHHVQIPSRAIIVENGSTDDTAEIADELAQRDYGRYFTVTKSTSAAGLGYAYREGINRTEAELVVLSADDLPFGTSDIDFYLQQPHEGLIIGSKAHPQSLVDRAPQRLVASQGFRLLRKAILRSRVGDSQGTVIVDGEWVRETNSKLKETGYLISTEIIAYAEATSVPVSEIPIELTPRQSEHPTRILLSDVAKMGLGLISMRLRIPRDL